MKNHLLNIIALFLFFLIDFAYSPAQGTIKGNITHEDEKVLPQANVALYTEGALYKGSQTDMDGNYILSEIKPGVYDLEISYVGYQPKRISDIKLSGDETKFIDCSIKEGVTLDFVAIEHFDRELFKKGKTSTGGTVSKEYLKHNRCGKEIDTYHINNQNKKEQSIQSSKDTPKEELIIRSRKEGSSVYYIGGIKAIGPAPPTPKMMRIAKRIKKKQTRNQKNILEEP